MNGRQVWIVGQTIEKAPSGRGNVWEFQGLFATEAEAIDACVDATYFIGPAVIGERLTHEWEDWPGARYPKAETA